LFGEYKRIRRAVDEVNLDGKGIGRKLLLGWRVSIGHSLEKLSVFSATIYFRV